jgi:PPK2 family polyphosphate:nucleotide phosphotransferase
MSEQIADCRVEPGQKAKLAARSTSAKFGLDRKTSEAQLAELTAALSILHNRLWAEQKRSVLLVLQGLDASGKDGTIKRVFTGLNPQGCTVHSFKAPNDEDLAHDYLWRVHNVLPPRGYIGIFNRSHYEDAVTTKVLGIINDKERERRHQQINDFERILAEEGMTLLKVFLHLGKDEQRKRLQARLDDPEKRWKFRLDDLETRSHWDEYQRLYDETITATSTKWAPWHIVPADHKWVSGHVVASLLVDALEALDPQTPAPAENLDGIVVE